MHKLLQLFCTLQNEIRFNLKFTLHISHLKLYKSVWAEKSTGCIHGFCNHPPICWWHSHFYLEPWLHSWILAIESTSYQTPVHQYLGVPLNLIETCPNEIHHLSPSSYILCLSWMHSVTSSRSLALTLGCCFSFPSTPNQFPSTINYSFFVYLPLSYCLILIYFILFLYMN